jgi:hypothetical protein
MFPACSRSVFQSVEGQANFIGEKPEFATLTIGGNDANFFDVVESYIYQYKPGFYGPEYPDESGACAQAIKKAQLAISNPIFANNLRILALQRWRQEISCVQDFLTGYAHFFNVDADATRCNNQSFCPTLGRNPKLSMELRVAINDLVEQVNNNPNIHFVDISPGFNGHRFCEPKKITTITTRTTSKRATPPASLLSPLSNAER